MNTETTGEMEIIPIGGPIIKRLLRKDFLVCHNSVASKYAD